MTAPPETAVLQHGYNFLTRKRRGGKKRKFKKEKKIVATKFNFGSGEESMKLRQKIFADSPKLLQIYKIN